MPSEISLDLIKSFSDPLSRYLALEDEDDQIWTLVLREGNAEIKRRSWAEIECLAEAHSVRESRVLADCCPSMAKPVVVLCALCPKPGCKLVHAHLLMLKPQAEENHGQEAGQLPV